MRRGKEGGRRYILFDRGPLREGFPGSKALPEKKKKVRTRVVKVNLSLFTKHSSLNVVRNIYWWVTT